MGAWAEVQIGDICHVIGGGTPAKSNGGFYTGSIPWATVRDMNTDVISETDCHITEDAVQSCSTNVIPAGNVVIATRVGLGKVCILEHDTAINQDLRGVVPRQPDSVHPRYLFHWFRLVAPAIVAAGTGATVQGVKVNFVKSLRLPLPTLPEQERIVAILDAAFAAIATATANAERNLANAQRLFESHLHAVLEHRTSTWSQRQLGDVCENLDSRRIPITKSKRRAGDVPYYGASGAVDHVADYLFDEDLLLVSEDGANLLARTYPIAFSIGGRAWVNNHAHVLRFGKMAHQRFVEYYLNSITLEPFVSGMAQPKLNQRALNSIPVPWSDDVSVVEAIVESLEATERKSDMFFNHYQHKFRLLTELKQSILHKAFTGELTADFNAADVALPKGEV